MSERAYLARELPDGSLEYTYLHAGELDHAGPTLQHHYRDPDQVAALLQLGGLSTIGPDLGPPPETAHALFLVSPERSQYCYAYRRDRKDTGWNAELHTSISLDKLTGLINNPYALTDIEHLYLYSASRWLYYAKNAAAPVPLRHELVDLPRQRQISAMLEKTAHYQKYK